MERAGRQARSGDCGRSFPENDGHIDLIDTARYPVNRRGTDAYGALVAQAKAGLGDQNCARLGGFVRPETLEKLRAEAREAVPQATYTEGDFNPYFSDAPEG